MANLLQNLANGVRAQFPSTPSPTNATLSKSQAMPGTGSANANAQNTVNTLFGSKTTTPTQQTTGNQAPAMPQITQQPVNINMSGMKGLTFAGNQAPTANNSSYSGGSIVDYLNSSGQKSDYATRAGLAQKYGITGYGGTAEQNTQLLNAMRNGTQSSQTPPNTQPAPTPTPTYQQAPQGNSTPSGTPTVSDTPPQTTPTPQPNQQVPQTQPQGNIGQAGQAQDMTYGGLIQQLLAKGQEAATKRSDLDRELSKQITGELNSPTSLEFKTGHIRNIENAYAQQKAAAEGELANITNIYNSAIGATKPMGGTAYAFDPVTGQVMGGGQGIGQAGNVVGNLAIAQRLPEMQANLSVAKQSQDTINNLMSAVPELNQSSFTDLNKFLEVIGSKVSDPNYQTLANALTQFIGSVANATGQTPDAIALNTRTQGQSMGTVLANLMAQANNKYAALSNQSAGTNLPVNTMPTIGSSIITGSSSSGGGSSLYDF